MVMRSHRCCVSLALMMGTCLMTRAASAGVLQVKPPAVQVVVTNDAASDVVVYAYRSGSRVRIGYVVAHSHGLVTVPAAMAAPGRMQLLLHPVPAGEDFLVDEVTIHAAEEHAELHVVPIIDESSVAVVAGTVG
jgi:hypothetical protein